MTGKIRKLKIILLLVLCAALFTACREAAHIEANIPYERMTDSDAQYIRSLWDGTYELAAGSYGLQEAIRAKGRCWYINRLGGLGYTEEVPEDAEYLGETTAPCEALTTPKTNLQTNYAPEGCEVYWGTWPVQTLYGLEEVDMFFIQTEPGSKQYALMFVSSYTRPPYYDEGRWMLHPEGAAAP